ncbi:hypothetical protein BCR33DRAFT_850947 [Rhizoclosmatium globosum]|uniref:SAM domain-containing protein n=1 Tax=Rhizoclosmatium globosum TaxID=329046 RepID=A0A1Y2C9P3_9FUNG|nr:hypothetical protein BCR33DRAFT_850947 [Rhizoclosmatium globosum]|eukprot:ORY43753.1 hypothetical protein BCR33DRAFT_850947 [Rhizoclosmatium globosum]
MGHQDLSGAPLLDFSGLSHLTFIGLAYNFLTGPLPKSLPKSLTGLGIFENVSGAVPPLPAGMQLLQLNSTSSRLAGSVPALPDGLTILQLVGGSMTGGIPSDLPTSLAKLVLEDLGLTGSIPAGVSKIPASQISLKGNCFSNAASFNVENACPAVTSSPLTESQPITTITAIAVNPITIGGIATAIVGTPSETVGVAGQTGSSDSSSKSSNGSNVGLIAGVTCGVILLVVGAIVLYCCWRRRVGKNQDSERQLYPKHDESFIVARREIAVPYIPTITESQASLIDRNTASVPESEQVSQQDSHQSKAEKFRIPTTNTHSSEPLSVQSTIPSGLGSVGVSGYNSLGPSNIGTVDTFYDDKLARKISGDTAVVGKAMEHNLGQDPIRWSVQDTAAWIARNGGRAEGGQRAAAELIDGNALVSVEDAKEILDIVQCETLGERVRLKNAILALKQRTQSHEAPPSYF